MNIDFLALLAWVVIITGIVYALDKCGVKILRKIPFLVDVSRSLFWVLFIVLIIRAFIVQPFRVPTGSLEPTVMPGDFIFVNQSAYGLRMPIINKKFFGKGEPQIGDIAVFRLPTDPSIDYVKRVVGTPGDRVQYINKVLYINGEKASQHFLREGIDVESSGDFYAQERKENLQGVEHRILVRQYGGLTQDFDLVVPEGTYYMMGDNRDNSGDSRYFGPVEDKYLIGKAFWIWMSYDANNRNIRWDRFGRPL